MEDASQIVRVRVVEVHGRAPRDAVVETSGRQNPASSVTAFDRSSRAGLKLWPSVSGPEQQTMTVTGGTTIPGRLVPDGKPVAKAEVGLVSHTRSSGTMFFRGADRHAGGMEHLPSQMFRRDAFGLSIPRWNRGRPEHLSERCELRDEG